MKAKVYSIQERTIHGRGEAMTLHVDGTISRPRIGMRATGQWKITGAVSLSRSGRITKYYSLNEILIDPDHIPWKYANGKQRTRLLDLDHGSPRIWCNPGHKVA